MSVFQRPRLRASAAITGGSYIDVLWDDGSGCRLADSTRHWHPWAQDLYAQTRQRGHEHHRAIRTLGRVW